MPSEATRRISSEPRVDAQESWHIRSQPRGAHLAMGHMTDLFVRLKRLALCQVLRQIRCH
jgi:hypothetical protein